MVGRRSVNNNPSLDCHRAFHDEECSDLEGPRSVVSVDLEIPYEIDQRRHQERQQLRKSILDQSEHFLHRTNKYELRPVMNASDSEVDTLARKQLNIFSMFDANHKPIIWPSTQPLMCGSARDCFNECSHGGTYFPESTDKNRGTPLKRMHWIEQKWRMKAESLERECSALKELVRLDSNSIMKLKTALEKMYENEKKHQHEILLLKSDLKKAKRYIEVFSREHEDFAHRETQHLETIKILKSEINEWTEQGQVVSDQQDVTQVESLKLENELFAVQVVENERQLNRVSAILDMKEAQNEELRLTVESLQNAMSVGEETILRGTMGTQIECTSNESRLIPKRTSQIVEVTPAYAIQAYNGDFKREEMDSVATKAELRAKTLDTSSDSTFPESTLDISPQPGPVQLEISALTASLKEKEAEIRNLKTQVKHTQQTSATKQKAIKDECSPLDVLHDWCS